MVHNFAPDGPRDSPKYLDTRYKAHSDENRSVPIFEASSPEPQHNVKALGESAAPNRDADHQSKRRRICGMKPWVLMVGVLVFTAIVVGAVLGGVLGTRNASHGITGTRYVSPPRISKVLSANI